MDTTLSNIVIHGVQPNEINEAWPHVAHWLQEALQRDGLHTLGLDDVYLGIKTQNMQLWMVFAPTLKAAVVTQIDNYPKRRVLTVLLLAGDELFDWLDGLNDVLARFGRFHHCTALSCHGRKGWVKALKKLGWNEITTTVSMEL